MAITPYYEDDNVTLYCGDCREVLPTLERADLVLTDPPYGIALANHNTTGTRPGGKREYSAWVVTGDADHEVGQWLLDTAMHHDLPTIAFASPQRPWLGTWRQYLVWDKGGAVGGGGDVRTCWKQSWELIQVARTPVLNGGRDGSVLRFPVTPRDYHHHPTQKPVALLRYLIEKASQPDDLILDPFAGSGSTLVAAIESGRRAAGIEIDERYCAIAVERLRAIQPLLSGMQAA